MSTNPIQYTSRTFATVLADINSDKDLIDKPDWFKRAVAGIMDVMSVIENASANQAFLRTGFTRRAVWDLARLIDYYPTERSTSGGELLFDLAASASPPFTVLQADLVGFTVGTLAVSSRRYEARTDLSVILSTEVTGFADWNVGNDQVTVASVLTTGEKVRISTTVTMPSPFLIDTDYFAIYVDDTHVRLATSRSNANAGIYVDIATQGAGNHTLTRLSRTTACHQQTSVASATIGASDGSTAWQEFPIAVVGILDDTLVVTINSAIWTQVDTFVNSGAADKHYRVIYQTDDTCVVTFGDGTYGEIPAAFDVYVEYAYGGGLQANVSGVDQIRIYGGSDSDVVGVTNPSAFTGAAEAEAIETTKVVAPMLLKARDRFVTTEDGEALALNFGGVALAKVNKNTFGVLSCQVVAVANGGGNPSAGLRTLLQAYLVDRSILETPDVRVQAATITSTAVTSAAKMQTGYSWANVEQYFELAWGLFLTETGQEIQTTYEATGIADAVTLINQIFATSFGASDYTAIVQMLDILEPRLFGEDIEESDAFAFVQGSVDGIAYMTIAVPSFPVAVAADEITTPGALTLTEIP